MRTMRMGALAVVALCAVAGFGRPALAGPNDGSPQEQSQSVRPANGKSSSPVSVKTLNLTQVSAGLQGRSYLRTYCLARRAAGFKTVAVTMLPRAPGVFPDREVERQSFNTTVRAQWMTYADGLADIGGDATIGQPGQQTSSYYCDQVHLVDKGYAIVAAYVQAALLPLLPCRSGRSSPIR